MDDLRRVAGCDEDGYCRQSDIARVEEAKRRKDRNDERLFRCLVRGVHLYHHLWCLGGYGSATDDPGKGLWERAGSSDLGGLHEELAGENLSRKRTRCSSAAGASNALHHLGCSGK